ncbi:ketopantoate reductase C-terminal domain-containing protein, partial [Enterococcus faecalis]|uniref:ketopantoate reductase C-terminal domain-containing protein n=1 Tax=Enterococcus faecalis TaxID=1351 RepID=UPI002935727E
IIGNPRLNHRYRKGFYSLFKTLQQNPLDKQAVLQQIRSCYNRETIGLHHPSMYQDLITNHRLTEIDYINGAIVRKGKVYGIATPYCQFLTELIHCKENLLHAK